MAKSYRTTPPLTHKRRLNRLVHLVKKIFCLLSGSRLQQWCLEESDSRDCQLFLNCFHEELGRKWDIHYLCRNEAKLERKRQSKIETEKALVQAEAWQGRTCSQISE